MHSELFTIGHSNQPLEHFLELLSQQQVTALVDIRRFPGSRKFPQFSQEHLPRALEEAGCDYHWIEALGGRRPRSTDIAPSLNSAWRNQSFHNYADYMQTGSFRTGIHELSRIAAEQRTAIMCSESVFWRCHRRLVSDFWTAAGGAVWHIFPDGKIRPHQLTEGAVVDNGTVIYPGQKTLFD